jgi:CheY-like chemotaxis protein
LPRRRPDPPPVTDGPRALLVDDNPVNRRIGRALLESVGCRVDDAASGPEALERCERREYDIVFLDYRMPGMDGVETVTRIRAAEREGGGRLPVVAMTADAHDEDRKRCLDAGMDDYLIKPVSKSEIRRVLAQRVGAARGLGD